VSYRDEERLELVLELIEHLNRRLEGVTRERFLADKDEIDLTAYRLSIIGENCSKLAPDLKARHDIIDWIGMAAMRNVIAHDYAAVDAKLVWETLGEDLTALANMCRIELGLIDPA
jgi:uncharacterized protein with HEPN domain